MVISSFISSILILTLGLWAYARLEVSMNLFAERQLMIEPSKFSYKMWKDMPVSMYQSFTFFNLTNWQQVKAIGQKPRFVEVGPYVYKTIWSKTDVHFQDDDKLVNFGEKKQWHFQAHLSRGYEDDLIWTINTPLMTALALIQNAPVITRNIVSVILDGLGEGAFIKRPIRSLLFEGYSDLIVSVGPLFDRRFANFNGKFAYLYNKNDTIDGQWQVSTGANGDLTSLNKITRFHSAIVNMTGPSMPQGLNEVKAECAPAWSLEQSTNGQLFAPFNRDLEQLKLQRQLQQIRARTLSKQQLELQQAQVASQQANSQPLTMSASSVARSTGESIVQAPKRFFSRISSSVASSSSPSSSGQQQFQNNFDSNQQQHHNHQQHHHQQTATVVAIQDRLQQLKDFGKFIFYPDLCRPIHLLPSKTQVTSDNGIEASRYFIDPRVFMNSSQFPSNKCYEMNPRPPLANALAATLNNAGVSVPNLMTSASSPFALFIPPTSHHQNNHHNHHYNHHNHHNHHHHDNSAGGGGLFERSNGHVGAPAASFLNNALHTLSASANQAADQLTAAATSQQNSPIGGRLSRVRQLFNNIVSHRMSANPLLPSLSSSAPGAPAAMHNNHLSAAVSPLARSAPGDLAPASATQIDQQPATLQPPIVPPTEQPPPVVAQPPPPPAPLMPALLSPASADRWITQFRFKWPRGVFSIGQCQLGAPIYVSLPHFLDADEYYLEQVDGLKPNRSLHEFYIDVESTLHSIPVGAKARLQLNIATPELRFRNIPNAMIPVLWQEVTFKIDKPVATLLYWSFTMSSSIYKSISVLLLCLGTALLIYSFVGGLKSRACTNARGRILRARSHASSSSSSTSTSARVGPMVCDLVASSATPCARSLSCATSGGVGGEGGGSHRSRSTSRASSTDRPASCHFRRAHHANQLCHPHGGEGRRSSWQHIAVVAPGADCKLSQCKLHCQCGDESGGGGGGGVLNQAYANSCNELHQQQQQHHHHNSPDHTSRPFGGPATSLSSPTSGGGKQGPWSRASSHCELMSSFGQPTLVTHAGGSCSRCLFACLRHSGGQTSSTKFNGPTTAATTTTSDIGSQVVRQKHHKLASDMIDTKTATSSSLPLCNSSGSSSSSGGSSTTATNTLDSCSSFYGGGGGGVTIATRHRSRKFK